MAFDLKAATAARNEAAGKPFEFNWEDEHFVVPAMRDWSTELSVEFLEALEAADERPSAMFTVFRKVIGEADWERFARTVPQGALEPLFEELASAVTGGGETPDLSQPSEPALIPT